MDHGKQLHQDQLSLGAGVVVSDRQSHDSQSTAQTFQLKPLYSLSLVLAGLCACASVMASLSQPIGPQHGPLIDLLVSLPNSNMTKEDYNATKNNQVDQRHGGNKKETDKI